MGEALPEEASLFERVVRASGLAAVISRSAIARACDRAGVDASALDVDGLAIALPNIEETIRLYLPDEADARLFAVRALLPRFAREASFTSSADAAG